MRVNPMYFIGGDPRCAQMIVYAFRGLAEIPFKKIEGGFKLQE